MKIMKKETIAILIGVVLAIVDIISFSSTKYIYNHKTTVSLVWLIVPFLFYGSQIGIFYYGLAYSTMAELNIIWNILSSFLVTVIGLYFFKEKLNHLKMLAIGLGLLSLVLFSMSGDK